MKVPVSQSFTIKCGVFNIIMLLGGVCAPCALGGVDRRGLLTCYDVLGMLA